MSSHSTGRALAHAALFSFAALLLSIAGVLLAGFGFSLAGKNLPELASLALSVAGPAFAALIFLRWKKGGFAPIAKKQGPGWLLLGVLPPLYLGAALGGAKLSGSEFVVPDVGPMLKALAINLGIIALLEEIGWRGYLTHTLLARVSPLTTSLIVGAVWFAWHLPKFGIGIEFVALLGLSCIGVSIAATILLRWCGLVSAVLLHASANLSQVVLDPVASSMEAQLVSFAATSLLSVVLAGALIAANRDWFTTQPPR